MFVSIPFKVVVDDFELRPKGRGGGVKMPIMPCTSSMTHSSTSVSLTRRTAWLISKNTKHSCVRLLTHTCSQSYCAGCHQPGQSKGCKAPVRASSAIASLHAGKRQSRCTCLPSYSRETVGRFFREIQCHRTQGNDIHLASLQGSVFVYARSR